MASLEELLFRGESETLDFKRDQYPFVGADDASKSELLKDILAMGNAWRVETARILVGVDSPAGGPLTVVGISQHLDDADLQQFVNSKTQRPVSFSYFTAEIQGVTVGVIEIPVQTRPLFLKKNFGKLSADVVYLRRGSSTVQAKPDEIARMGQADQKLGSSDLRASFAVPRGRKILGPSIKIRSTVVRVDQEPDIPDYSEAESGLGIAIRRVNPEFYRELVKRTKDASLLNHVALTVANHGSLFARETRVEMEIHDPERIWEFREPGDVDTDPPERLSDFLYRAVAPAAPDDFERNVEYVHESWHLSFEVGNLQPGRTVWPAIDFYVGARCSGELSLIGKVLADGLTEPIGFTLKIAAEVDEREVTLGFLETAYLERYFGNSEDEQPGHDDDEEDEQR